MFDSGNIWPYGTPSDWSTDDDDGKVSLEDIVSSMTGQTNTTGVSISDSSQQAENAAPIQTANPQENGHSSLLRDRYHNVKPPMQVQTPLPYPTQPIPPQPVPSQGNESQTAVPKAYSSLPKAPIVQPVPRPKLTSSSLVAIANRWGKLCALDKYGSMYLLWPADIRKILHVVPHPYYRQSPHYLFEVRELNEPIRITDDEFRKSGTLRSTFFRATSIEVATLGFPRKVDELLRNFVERSAERISIDFYYGWTCTSNTWDFWLCGGKTHGDGSMKIGKKTCQTADAPAERSAAEVALQRSTELMQAITNDSVRQTLWLYIHAAALYSFLKGIGHKMSTGLCICSQNQNVLRCIGEILSWYGDTEISLAEAPQSFSSHLLERKDQPLLLWDEPGSKSNTEAVLHSLQTGELPFSKKTGSSAPELEALTVILSDGKSRLCFDANLLSMELDGEDLVDDAYDFISSRKPYLQEYLNGFIRFICQHQQTVAQDLQTNLDAVYKDLACEGNLSRRMLETLGILQGLSEIIKQYCRALSPADEWMPIISDDCTAELMELFHDRSQYQEHGTAIEALFFKVAQRKLEQGHFDLRQIDEANPEEPCQEGKQGIVYIAGDHICFTVNAYKAICDDCRCSTRVVQRALRDAGVFKGKPINPSTVQTRIGVTGTDEETATIAVYKMDRSRFISPMESAAEIKDDAECDFILQLGHDKSGRPMMWRGIENSHISITGRTGTGKSYFIRRLIAQLPEQNVRCIVFDCAGDYSSPKGKNPPGWPLPNEQIINMQDSPIGILPFTPVYPNESPISIAKRVANTISVPLKFGKRQQSFLSSRIAEGLTNNRLKEFSDLREFLKSEKNSKATAEGVILALEGLWESIPKGGQDFDWDFEKPGVTIVNLHKGYDDLTLEILIEMLLGTIYSARMTVEQDKYPPVVLVFDECQRLNWSESSFAHRIMTEGRKYGISVWLSTQYTNKPNVINALGQAELRVCFRPADKHISKIAKSQCISDSSMKNACERQLQSLQRGQFLYVRNHEIHVSAAP